ncbi:phosphate/phosphite/phosphonate ABC transporter substrate-binding protein [Tepidibacillus infernus]|uniref:Phosphonate ABC transporter substrate-binding protein n=1 Tax=Tepidibacillus decaturensis TaxID=1413211 RepID=A0A135L531_9BACI|nr:MULTISPECIES: phosphate/phosphite/phosphonate ABC transporter substrate-binding protein [Tepidibacillus]KXG44098.1 hypothetical protein U473_08855 [Tepidibacillus decaturensis]GBF10494.1 phosphate-import protein PhnD precursor [Tepidibacillus sp. HK-1]
MRKLFFSLMTILLFFSTACSSQESLPYVSLSNQNQQGSIQDREPENAIRVGIASVISPQATRVGYDALVDYMEENLNLPITLIQGKTYAEMNQLIKEGKVDIAFICTLSYVMGEEDEYMDGIAAPMVDGKPLYRSYTIVRKDSGISSLEDLKGKSFAFTDPNSYSGRLAMLYLLKMKGETAESFFSKTYYTYSHDYSVKAVTNGLVDGAAVDSLVYDQMKALDLEETKNIQIIENGEWVGTPPIVVSKKVSTNLKKQTQDLLLNMNQEEKGKQILKSLNIEQFVPIDYKNYQPILEMAKAVGEQP